MHLAAVVFKFTFVKRASAFFSSISARRFFTIVKVIITRQVWFFQIMFKVIIFVGQTLSSHATLDNQSAANIITEIDDKSTSDSRKIILGEESREDLSQQAQVGPPASQFLQYRVLQREGERGHHELTHFPFRSWCEICQRAKGLHGQRKHQSQKKSSVTQLDHSFCIETAT